VSGADALADRFPPAKINDLTLTYDEPTRRITLSFTAPGDDFNEDLRELINTFCPRYLKNPIYTPKYSAVY